MSINDTYIKNNSCSKEYYKVYNKNGEFLMNIDRMDEKYITNQYLKGATCFVINENGQVLLEKRANTELTPGKIDLVSGHLDDEEVSKQAIVRELSEEIGIPEQIAVNAVRVFEKMPLSFESKGKIRNFFIDFYYLFTNSSNLKYQAEEVKSVAWASMDETFELIKSGKTKFPKENENVDYSKVFESVKNAYLDRKKCENNKVKKVLGE